MEVSSWVQNHKWIAITAAGLCLLVLVVTVVLVTRSPAKKALPTSVTVVSFNDGSNEIIVDRTGRATIKTPFGTFTQYWDKKICSFFENLDNLDFDTLAQYLGTEAAVSLTTSSGQVLVIDSTMLPQVIMDEFQTTLEDTYETEQVTVVKTTPPAVWQTPRPTSTTKTPVPVENPWHTGTEPQVQPFSCEAYKVDGVRRVIVSQTLCGE